MAITTRYFGVTANGAGDGTTWNDRAALFTGGAWSTVITGFNFAGSDSLLCLIGPGTHTITAALANASFSNVMTNLNMLFLHGCDSSGNALSPPDSGWKSCEPAWSDATLPVIACTTNISILNASYTNCRLLKFTSSATLSAGIIANCQFMDWCQVVNTASNTSAVAVGNVYAMASNCYFSCTGSSYSAIATPVAMCNVRVEGVTGSSGNREGIVYSGNLLLYGVTVCNCGGDGIRSSSSNVAIKNVLDHCLIVNNGGDGIQVPNTASQTQVSSITNTVITGNGGYGINTQGENCAMVVANCRLRDNTSGNISNLTNEPTNWSIYTTDSDDATEYVAPGSGNFTVKASSAIYNTGVGVADEAVSAGYRQSIIGNTPGVWSL